MKHNVAGIKMNQLQVKVLESCQIVTPKSVRCFAKCFIDIFDCDQLGGKNLDLFNNNEQNKLIAIKEEEHFLVFR